jgi:hypothetical protein
VGANEAGKTVEDMNSRQVLDAIRRGIEEAVRRVNAKRSPLREAEPSGISPSSGDSEAEILESKSTELASKDAGKL